MPLKVSVGLSKKIGQPDYGSLGASCHVEYEADSTLLQHDLDAFQRQVKSAFIACRQAVQDELYRAQNGEQVGQAQQQQQQPVQNGNINGHQPNGNGSNGHQPNGNGQRRTNGRKVTQSQLRALDAIADRLQLDLANWLHNKYGLRLASDLTVKEASTIIDELNKTPTNGGRQ